MIFLLEHNSYNFNRKHLYVLIKLSLFSASFLGRSEPFLLKNGSNLIHEFLFLYKNSNFLNLMHFQGEMAHFFPQKKAIQSESVKYIIFFIVHFIMLYFIQSQFETSLLKQLQRI